MLVAEAPGAARRRTLRHAAGYAAVLLVVLAAGGWVWHADAANNAAIGKLSAAMDDYRQTASRLPLDPVTSADLPPIVPLLDQARALPFGDAATTDAAGAGLSQAAKLGAASRIVYQRRA